MVKAIQEIALSGFLSVSHRSAAFMDISKKAIEGLRENMGIPMDYHIFYQPSATASMDTLLRNLVRTYSYHFVHGSFSELFYKTALGLGLKPSVFKTALDQPVNWSEAKIPANTELIAITHNETSTGLIWPKNELHEIRKMYPLPLIAIDVTSSFGCMTMDWNDADIWLGSLHKGIGLPSGLGFLIVNKRSIEKAIDAKNIAAWQRFSYILEKMKQYQTPETPNMLNIALLAKQMEDWDLVIIEKDLLEKAKLLYEADLPWKPFIDSKEWQSPTVTNFIVDNPDVYHQKAKNGRMILGKGYGPLANTTIRISNFPAITKQNIIDLIQLLK
jgi:phosphoserine aminotransferase